MKDESAEKTEELVDEEEETVAPSFGEIKDEAKEEVGEVVGRVKKAGLTPFRRAVDDVVDRGLDLLDTLADVWAGKKKKKKD